MAQSVFSVNAVGYVNVTARPGFNLIANPLTAANNTVGALITGAPNGATIYKFDSAGGQFSVNAFVFGAWQNPAETLNPGEGAFFLNPTAADVRITFVGEVPQGSLSTPLPAGFSIKASQVPQAGTLTALGFPAAQGDTVFQFDAATQGFATATFAFGSWQPAEPSLAVGESVFVNKAAAGSWDRTFSVNP